MNYIKLSFFLLVVFASLAGAPQVFASVLLYDNAVTPLTTNYAGDLVISGLVYENGTFEGIEIWLRSSNLSDTATWTLASSTEANHLDCTSGTHTFYDYGLTATSTYSLIVIPFTGTQCFLNSNTWGFDENDSTLESVFGNTNAISLGFQSVQYLKIIGDLYGYDSDTTRIIDVDPNNDIVVASSTPTTVGATYYVSDLDFDDDMTLEIEVRNNAQNASQLVGPIFSLFQEQRFVYNYEQDINSSGSNSYASTTLFTQVGRYTAETKIKKPLFSVFGFGLLSQTVVATTTQFLVATTTAFDALQDGNIALAGQLSGVTGNLDCDSGLTSLSPRKFIACMFFFDYTGLQTVMNEARSGFLTSWPLGYGTRFVSILTDSATSSLPAINYTFGTTSPLYVLGLTSIELDPFAELSDPENIVNTKSDQTQQKSVMEIMSQIINIIVYLTLAFMIIHDLTNVMKHHHRK